MKTITNLHRLTAFLLTACALAAAPITVENHSFETFAPGAGACAGAGCLFDHGPVPGWTATGGDHGSWQPGLPVNAVYFNYIPDGNLVGYANNVTMEQTVGVTVEGVTYTLEVEIGRRADGLSGTGPALAQLRIGTTLFGATGIVPSLGNFSSYTVAYTGAAAHVGQTITIMLGPGTAGGQGNFDNVRLSASDPVGGGSSPVPEPASMLPMAGGLAAGTLRSRRVKL